MQLLCEPWATVEDIIKCEACADIDEDILEDMLLPASELLYVLSGRQFNGLCTESVRPCRKPIIPDNPAWDLVNRATYEMWRGWAAYWNFTWGQCGCGWEPGLSGCSCAPIQAIKLGREEIDSIEEVIIDGVPLADTAYVVLERTWLVRIDGNSWPMRQDVTKPLTESNTWGVTFTYGNAPPALGVVAAASLACQFALGCTGSNLCLLPKRAQTLTRQGMTVAFLDPFDFLNHGRTGVYEVDLFLSAMNPNNLQEQAMVFSPDYPGRTTVQTTWQAGS